MNPTMPKPAVVPSLRNEAAAPSLQSVVRKSALLNLTIVLTSFPVLAFAGGRNAVMPALAVMAAISIVIWAATFALFSFVSLARIFWTQGASEARTMLSHPTRETGVVDRWLDGPV